MNSFDDVSFGIMHVLNVFIAIALLITIIALFQYYFIKFGNRAMFKSIQLEQSLKSELAREKDPITQHVNLCVRRTTVEYRNNREEVLVHIPTKRFLEIGSKSNIKQLIKQRVEAEEFRETLTDVLPAYRFEPKVRYRSNEYILKGSRF